MTATNIEGSVYSGSNRAAFPLGVPAGMYPLVAVQTMATTSTDEAGDRVALFEVESGRTIVALGFANASLAASALELDFAIAQDAANPTALGTEVTLVDSSAKLGAAYFATAHTTLAWVYVGHKVVDTVRGKATVRTVVATGGTTPASGALTVVALIY